MKFKIIATVIVIVFLIILTFLFAGRPVNQEDGTQDQQTTEQPQ